MLTRDQLATWLGQVHADGALSAHAFWLAFGFRSADRRQTPLLVGDADQVLFRGQLDFPALFRFSRRRHYYALSLDMVERFDRWASSLKHPFPRLRHSLGRAYLELGELDQAMRLLDLAKSESPPAFLFLRPPGLASCAGRVCHVFSHAGCRARDPRGLLMA